MRVKLVKSILFLVALNAWSSSVYSNDKLSYEAEVILSVFDGDEVSLNAFAKEILTENLILKQDLEVKSVVARDDVNELRRLIGSKDISPKYKVHNGLTLLEYSATYGSAFILEFLLKDHGDTFDHKNKVNALGLACRSGSTTVVDKFISLEGGKGEPFVSDACIHAAIERNDPVMLGVLIDSGADVNVKSSRGMSPLELIDELKASQEILRLLIEDASL